MVRYVCLHLPLKKINHSCRWIYQSHGSYGWITIHHILHVRPDFFGLQPVNCVEGKICLAIWKLLRLSVGLVKSTSLALKIGSLESHLQSSIDNPCTELHDRLKDDDWKKSYLQRLLLVLQVLNCPLSSLELNSSTVPETASSLNVSDLKSFFESTTHEERAEVLLQMLEDRAPRVGPTQLDCTGLQTRQRQQIHIAASLLTKQGKKGSSIHQPRDSCYEYLEGSRANYQVQVQQEVQVQKEPFPWTQGGSS